ncbi:transglutaminase domain-containing protein [Naumannella sp. ID2617S]|nr:transglutaminase domain-containing protein [Naumannella sp. ID2617S]
MSATVLRPRVAPGPGAPQPSAPPRQPRGVAGLLVDLVAMLLLAGLVVLTFAPTFGHATIWRAGLGGAVLGIGVGLLTRLFRLPGWAAALATAAAYFLVGGALAMPSTATAGVLPNARVLTGLATAAVQAWKSALTVDPPIGESGGLLAVPLITLLIAAVVSVRLARSPGRRYAPGRWTRWAWLPWLVAGVVGILFGLHTAVWPAPIALGVLTVSLVWTALQRSRARHGVLTRTASSGAGAGVGGAGGIAGRVLPVGAGALVLGIAAAVSLLALPVLQPLGPRVVLRDVVQPPLQVHDWPSPLQGFRAYAVDRADQVQLTVDGLPAGSRIRVATLDVWDGVTYNVTDDPSATDGGTFRRIGDRVPDPEDGRQASVQVRAEAYQDVWVPTVGATSAVAFTGPEQRGPALRENFYLNRASQTALSTTGLRRGDQATLQAVVVPAPPADRLRDASAADASLPTGAPAPDVLKERLALWTARAGSDAEAVNQIVTRLRQGYYSHGVDHPSLPGHSAYRIERMFTDEVMVGDEEQYAVAMALMLREAGMPARVGYGFAPQGAGRVSVRGADVTAWVEVKYEGLGWVAYQPAPPKDRKPPKLNNPDPGQLRPQVENPPPPPERPEKVPPDETEPVPPKDQEPPEKGFDLVANLPWILGAGIPLLLLVLPAAAIIGVKLRRARSRRLARSAVTRVSGGWAEVIDRARDLGVPVHRSLTRAEAAQVLSRRFSRSADGPADPNLLAWRADATVFGTGTPTTRQAAEYWDGVRAVVRGMTRSVPVPRRLLALLALGSLRHRADRPDR